MAVAVGVPSPKDSLIRASASTALPRLYRPPVPLPYAAYSVWTDGPLDEGRSCNTPLKQSATNYSQRRKESHNVCISLARRDLQ
jgi:hypothetical protein